MTAPRLFAILARAAPVGVVFRRGPSKQVSVWSWDLRADRFELGQWLKGRIYERRADLSPDGRHLIYLAMDGRWQRPGAGSWTAVSRAPWLTALHLYPWGHCWNGGGLFLDDRRYWLNGTGTGVEHGVRGAGLTRVETPPRGVAPAMGEDPVSYLPRLVRDGWQPGARTGSGGVLQVAFSRPVCPGWALHKTFHAALMAGPHGESYFETHALAGPGGVQDLPGAEWADVDSRGDVVLARDGALWRLPVTAAGPGPARMLRDFTADRFEERAAPYAGVEIGR